MIIENFGDSMRPRWATDKNIIITDLQCHWNSYDSDCADSMGWGHANTCNICVSLVLHLREIFSKSILHVFCLLIGSDLADDPQLCCRSEYFCRRVFVFHVHYMLEWGAETLMQTALRPEFIIIAHIDSHLSFPQQWCREIALASASLHSTFR